MKNEKWNREMHILPRDNSIPTVHSSPWITSNNSIKENNTNQVNLFYFS